jgi:exodeoxyribonuclease V alpha subunit
MGQDDTKEHISGQIIKVVYRNDDTGYSVATLKTSDRQSITLVGSCGAIWEGELIEAQGSWTEHKQHGRQFQASKIQCTPPATKRGIERYLASGVIKGIGPVTAEALVQKFGTETLSIIESHSARLKEVPGIGRNKCKQIKASWEEQKATREIMIFLHGHGIGVAHAHKIYAAYRHDAVARVTDNPYALCRDIRGIGFATADKIALDMGIPRDSERRAQAGLLHMMDLYSDNGHCYAEREDLVQTTHHSLDINESIVLAALEHLIAEKALIPEGEVVYLKHLFQAEQTVAGHVHRLNRPLKLRHNTELDALIQNAERGMKINFGDSQKQALRSCLCSSFVIITGGPGVGKTTIIRALASIFKQANKKMLLAAPTGRASKRMEEASRLEALTLHRLLKYQPHTNAFSHNEENPLDGDVFILDEVSMMDVRLMASFLRAVPDRGQVILVGDIDQLPSVGPGNVLRDMIASETIPCARLDTVFRQSRRSLIVENAHRINAGEMPESHQGNDLSDFYFVESNDAEQVIARVLHLVSDRIPDRFGFDPMTEIQVLSPMRRNQLGVDALNDILQEKLNPRGKSIHRLGREYREGDRVMQIRNNYDREVYNGDVGRIVRIDTQDEVILVSFGENDVKYELNALDELVPAYCCSVHKSQGSEYPAVIIVLSTQHYKLLQRNLLYTAVTRGKSLVCIVGSVKALQMAIKNNEIASRKTGLRDRLAQKYPAK